MNMSQNMIDDTRECKACGMVYSAMRAECPECGGWRHLADQARARRYLQQASAPPPPKPVDHAGMLQRANQTLVDLHSKHTELKMEVEALKERIEFLQVHLGEAQRLAMFYAKQWEAARGVSDDEPPKEYVK